MIKYNNSNINDWFYNASDIIKVYYHDAVCYYKLTPSGQTPCFAVVADISQYSDTEFEDVYDKATEKWYKLNNLNAYEEYGVYGSSTATTYYDGKLVIQDGYEYQYSGSGWNNVGEISGDTPYDYSQDYLTLQALESGTIGFSASTVDYSTDSGSTWNTLAQGNTISVSQGDEVLFKKSGSIPTENYGIGTFTSSCRFNIYGNIMSMQEGDNFATATTIANYEFYFKNLFAESKVVSAENMVLPATTLRNFCYNGLFNTATYLTTPPKIFPATALTRDCYSYAFDGCTSLTKSPMLPALTSARASYGWMFQNCTSLSEVSCLATDVSAEYATYDWLSNVASSGTFYKNPNASWDSGNNGIPYGWTVEDYVEPSPFVYPVYYDEIQDPPNYLSFSSMTEAEEYECPWVGMKATIAGSGYTFSGDSQSGYEWVYNPSRLPVGYTEVQYIENTDYASLEINYHPNQDTRIVTTMQATSGNENMYGRFFGSGRWNCADGNHGYQFDYEEYPTGQLHISWGAECGWDTSTNVYGDYNVHTYDWNKNEFYIDNTLVDSTTYQNFTCENNLGIFAQIFDNGIPPRINNDENKEYLRGKLYDFKIYDDGTLVADLVPCTNPNNIVGAYDIVNDVFYTAVNQGYYFVAGPTV